MSRNIKARRRMPIAQRRQNYRELTFNKCGPDLRWRQHFDDNWDIIWPSAIQPHQTTPDWHPLLNGSLALNMYTDEMIRHAYAVDHALAYSEGDFENTLLSRVYHDAVTQLPVSAITEFDGFDVMYHGPYARDWRHGPDSLQEEHPWPSQLLWRVRRPWWVI